MGSSESNPDPMTTLKAGSFPLGVEGFLSESLLQATSSSVEHRFKLVFRDVVDKKATDVISRATALDDETVRRQLLGTLATLLRLRKERGIKSFSDSIKWKYMFDVGTLSTDETIFLQYPGKKTLEDDHHLGPFTLDYAVNIEGWVNTRGGTTPRHAEIFSDIYWKVKSARLQGDDERVASLEGLLQDIYEGMGPEDALETSSATDAFDIGNRLEPLVHSLYWIFIQEDFNYPRGQGREMSYGILTDICSLTKDDFTQTPEVYPRTVRTEDFPEYFDIITGESVKGFDPNGRGEMLALSTVTQDQFKL